MPDSNTQSQSRPNSIHLASKLTQQGFKIRGIGLMWILPIHINPVEDTRRVNVRRKIALQENIDARPDKRLAILRLSILSKIRSPSFKRDQNPQPGKTPLQQLDLMQVAVKRTLI